MGMCLHLQSVHHERWWGAYDNVRRIALLIPTMNGVVEKSRDGGDRTRGCCCVIGSESLQTEPSCGACDAIEILGTKGRPRPFQLGLSSPHSRRLFARRKAARCLRASLVKLVHIKNLVHRPYSGLRTNEMLRANLVL